MTVPDSSFLVSGGTLGLGLAVAARLAEFALHVIENAYPSGDATRLDASLRMQGK